MLRFLNGPFGMSNKPATQGKRSQAFKSVVKSFSFLQKLQNLTTNHQWIKDWIEQVTAALPVPPVVQRTALTSEFSFGLKLEWLSRVRRSLDTDLWLCTGHLAATSITIPETSLEIVCPETNRCIKSTPIDLGQQAPWRQQPCTVPTLWKLVQYLAQGNKGWFFWMKICAGRCRRFHTFLCILSSSFQFLYIGTFLPRTQIFQSLRRARQGRVQIV